MDLWRECRGAEHLCALQVSVYRLVETQTRAATLDLVDSLDEQALLEELLETSKPPLPSSAAHLPYLLQSPFRYPPLHHGSRFGSREQGGLFYASLQIATAMAETAFYRFVFIAGMTAAPTEGIGMDFSSFRVGVRAQRAACLDRPPFAAFEATISSPTDYAVPQSLGEAMRHDGVEAARYVSARDVRRGRNLVIFEPRFFTGPPRDLRTWHCTATAERVVFVAAHDVEGYQFERSTFLVDDVLPAPAG
ncbi:hypothetical protein BJI67_04135 [Acidihalobacter aeolianus]|uniref:RES domain-containing protein n=1 Tax=Acidihalobacter aeolianus TaxID=2792603 RepID=A0A1D8K5Z8_9GAMM|nr:RES family NAD+ phosphorylase [Acidihalobacter aeolianus]AOV16365.1 hypothetical protein BJI67_04135 [Acidihalobacter aeolianus]